jgi:hypothetical protein
MSFEFPLPVSDSPRACIIVDHGRPHTFQIIDNANIFLAADYATHKAAVVIWLPANSYAAVKAFKHMDDTKKPRFTFTYEVFNCSELYAPDKAIIDKLKAGEKPRVELPSAEYGEDDDGDWWVVECPVGTNQYQFKQCPYGQFGDCQDGTVVCVD